MEKRYSDYNTYLRKLFGQRVQKIAIDAGLSCPNRDTLLKKGCIYCNSKGSGSGLYSKGYSIKDQIEIGKIGMIKKYKAKKFLAYFQSFSNTYTNVSHMKDIYEQALFCDGIVGMAIGTRPDCINEEKLDLIESYIKDYLVWLEYGLQSVHDSTLKIINRGHDFKSFFNALNLTKDRGINVCAHVILGLPKESKSMMIETAKVLSDMPIDGVKIHLLYVIKGTKLDAMWQKGEYVPMNQEEYVDVICEFLEYLPKRIIIQRITADPHKEELQAPMWAKNYRQTFNMIQDFLEKKDSEQGKKYVKPKSV